MSREKSGGLSVTTLLLASASAATAAIVVPLVWEGGGVVAAAITPVIVALTSEALRRPVEKVSTVGVWRRTPQGTAIRRPATRDFDPLDPDEERHEVYAERPHDPFGLREPQRRVLTPRRIRIALITALLAFAIAAVLVTASELALFGDSVSGKSRTTFFGGKEKQPAREEATPAPEATQAPEATATPATTAEPEATATPAEPTPDAERQPTPEAPAPAATPPAAE